MLQGKQTVKIIHIFLMSVYSSLQHKGPIMCDSERLWERKWLCITVKALDNIYD